MILGQHMYLTIDLHTTVDKQLVGHHDQQTKADRLPSQTCPDMLSSAGWVLEQHSALCTLSTLVQKAFKPSYGLQADSGY